MALPIRVIVYCIRLMARNLVLRCFHANIEFLFSCSEFTAASMNY